MQISITRKQVDSQRPQEAVSRIIMSSKFIGKYPAAIQAHVFQTDISGGFQGTIGFWGT